MRASIAAVLQAAAIALTLATLQAARAEAAPARVASINLCADQLLLALADPVQIAALSNLAADPDLSFFAAEARRFRHDAGNAESIVGLAPDLVLAGSFTRAATRDMLDRLGFRLVTLDPVTSIADGIAQIRKVAGLLGHPQRGEALVATIERALAKARADAAGRTPIAALAYQRRGYVTGSATLGSDLLEAAGFANAGTEIAGPVGGFVPLERIVAEAPEVLIVSGTEAEDQGSALLAHPALARLYPPERRIVLDDRLTACGGPTLPVALGRLSAAAQAYRR